MANTHAEARAAAERARDALKARDAEKAAKAVPTTRDTFADTAAKAASTWRRPDDK